MTRSNALLECVCNFSEGRNEATINAIAHSISCIPHQYLLHVDSSPSANRTVMTFAGAPEAVAEATFQAIKIAGGLIDMHLQHGAHPRIGSTDVCPFIPLAHMSMEAAIAISKATAARIAQDLEIPSYLYEYSALLPHRKTLPQIRKGQYEGLHAKMQLPEWKPDYGDTISWDKVSRTGATVIGARKIHKGYKYSTKNCKSNAQQWRRHLILFKSNWLVYGRIRLCSSIHEFARLYHHISHYGMEPVQKFSRNARR
jgi:glutamate formiminotransferase